MASVRSMSCCAVREIAGIGSTYRADRKPPSIENTLIDVCGEIFHKRYETGKIVGMPHSFYIFTGVVGYKRAKTTPKYGPEFKDYILENRLGTITESEGEFNRVNHPTHLVKVWIWRPDPPRLKRWYMKRLPKVEVKKDAT